MLVEGATGVVSLYPPDERQMILWSDVCDTVRYDLDICLVTVICNISSDGYHLTA